MVNSRNTIARYAMFGNFQHTSMLPSDGLFFSLESHAVRNNLLQSKTSVLDKKVISPFFPPVGVFCLITSAEWAHIAYFTSEVVM